MPADAGAQLLYFGNQLVSRQLFKIIIQSIRYLHISTQGSLHPSVGARPLNRLECRKRARSMA